MKGLLLINLGTPDEPTPPAVRRYLREFLSDPRVIDINPVGRWLLLNAVILPFRPKQSAHAYQQVWTERGSPLLFHGEDLTEKVRERLGDDWQVELAMRYGTPSIAAALDRFVQAGVRHLIVFALYPQYASSSTGSTLEKLYHDAAAWEGVPHLTVVPPFYDDPGYLDVSAGLIRDALEGFEPDRVLFSFHGLPERQIRKADPSGSHCLASGDCCDRSVPANRWCYRFHCFETARGLASRLELPDDRWMITFQSRLGRTPWLQPFTDQVLEELPKEGVERVLMVSASFVADCLETLEELGMRGKESFEGAGGKELRVVPCLNSMPAWADVVARLARTAVGSGPALPSGDTQ